MGRTATLRAFLFDRRGHTAYNLAHIILTTVLI